MVGFSATAVSSFFSSSSAWAKVRSGGTFLKSPKTSVELIARFFTSRILPVKSSSHAGDFPAIVSDLLLVNQKVPASVEVSENSPPKLTSRKSAPSMLAIR